MANYTCTVRTNYFHVKDSEQFHMFMKRVYGAESSVELWEEKDDQGLPVFGFGSYGAIGGVRGSTEEAEDDASESGFDDFVAELQQHVQEGDAVIILEAGSEKLCYVVGSAEIVTSTDRGHLDISDLAQKRAAIMLNNPSWQTRCDY